MIASPDSTTKHSSPSSPSRINTRPAGMSIAVMRASICSSSFSVQSENSSTSRNRSIHGLAMTPPEAAGRPGGAGVRRASG
ncbi:MAG TPA: hypothetical protein VFC99_13310 [Acidimicrobiia bacterium]|nr:hypothetical protein [Acidimicrobiia bacterium]